jgi:uncharacterized membrane protein YfcA
LAGAIWHLASSAGVPAILSASVPSWLAVFVVIFIAAAVSSTVGFAFSAIAAAMILHLVPDNVAAVQIMMAASIGIQSYSVAALYRTISWRACMPFLIGGAATIPAGIYLLLSVCPRTYILAMGVALVVYGTYMLFRRPLWVQGGGAFANGLVGAIGGLTGPLAAFPGAFVTIWCGIRGWDKVVQRSIYQPYILVIQVLTLIVLGTVSERAVLDAQLLTYALPGVMGAYVGLLRLPASDRCAIPAAGQPRPDRLGRCADVEVGRLDQARPCDGGAGSCSSGIHSLEPEHDSSSERANPGSADQLGHRPDPRLGEVPG